jgi:outer membrane protein
MRSAVLTVLLLVSPGAGEAATFDLAACVDRALREGPAVASAADAAASAHLGREEAFVAYEIQATPRVSGGFQGDNRTDQRYEMVVSRRILETGTSVELSGGTRVFSSVPQVSIPYFSETRVTLAQPLLNGRSRLVNRDRIADAERRIDAAENALGRAREDVVLDVVRSFYDVVEAEELLGVSDRSVERVAGLAEMASGRLELGQVSKMDVYRASLNVARLQNARLDLAARRDRAIDSLKLLLGVDPEIEFAIDGRLQGPGLEGLDLAKAEEIALDLRPEIAEARERVADAEREVLVARHRLWPELDLVGSYARQGLGESFDDSTSLDREEWTVGFRSTSPLNRTAERVAIGVAEIELRGRERELRIARHQVRREVRDALRQLERVTASAALASEIADQADRQVELARLRYDRGVTDNFDLVQAELELAQARTGSVLARIEQTLAAAAIRRATATLVAAFPSAARETETAP